jgi:hypothetical protein
LWFAWIVFVNELLLFYRLQTLNKGAPMKVLQILLVILLVPGLTFAYKVVLKNGKEVEGTLVREDDSSIFLTSGGIQMNFKKDDLDLQKMSEINKSSTPIPEKAAMPEKPKTPKASTAKKPARVFTDQDVAAMKEVWEGSSVQTMPATAGDPPDAAPTAEPQTEPAFAEPRDEKTIKADIAAKKQEISELEKRIADLKAQNRVTATWEKMLEKQKQSLSDLQTELKASITARKAAEAADKQPN